MLKYHDYAISVFLLAFVAGCGDTQTTGTRRGATAAAQNRESTAFLVDMDGVRHRLSQTEADFLAGLVSAKPDVDTPDRIKLDPKYRVIIDEVDLALQPDELILKHRGGTKFWRSTGVRARILAVAGMKN